MRGVARRHRLLAVGLVVMAVGPWLGHPQWRPPSTPMLRLAEADVADVGSGVLHVSSQVVNDGGDARRGRVGWVLARLGPGPVWERRVYQSATRPVVVDPGRTVTTRWDEEVALPAGTYVFSAWVHVAAGSGFVHADSEEGRVVSVAAGEGKLLRHAPPRFGMTVTELRPELRPGAPTSIASAVVIENRSAHRRGGRVRLTLLSTSGPPDADWWRQPPAHRSDATPVDVMPGAAETVSVEMSDVPPGLYAVGVEIEPVEVDPGGLLDRVVLSSPVTYPAAVLPFDAGASLGSR